MAVMCFWWFMWFQKTHNGPFCGLCEPQKTHEPRKGPPCVFVVYINHKKHMKEANVVYVLHKKHVVGAFVVYVFLVVPCKPHVPPPCDFCGFTHTTFPSTTQTTTTHKPHLPRPCKPRFLHEPLFVPPYVFSSSMWFLFHMCFKRSVKNTWTTHFT